jgi:hypothetical protein
MAVTCRNALENAAVLENPQLADARAIGSPLASRSIAWTMRAR